MTGEMKFVTGEPAAKIGKALILSDLHIGIEKRFRDKGISLPSQLERVTSRLEALIKKTRAKRVVILGDIKHKVPGTSFQEEREIPAFFRHLMESVEVDISPGNHDGGIERLLPSEARIYPGSGFMMDKVWLCHGHAWPPEEFMEAGSLLMGHNHSSIEFRDGLGYRWTEPVWIRARLDRKRISEKYGEARESLPEIIMMPPFNKLVGQIPANRDTRKSGRNFEEGPSPLFRAAKRNEARVFMLDGTYLGKLGKL